MMTLRDLGEGEREKMKRDGVVSGGGCVIRCGMVGRGRMTELRRCGRRRRGAWRRRRMGRRG